MVYYYLDTDIFPDHFCAVLVQFYKYTNPFILNLLQINSAVKGESMCLASKSIYKLTVLAVWCLVYLFTASAFPVTRYVNVYNGSPQTPYTNWATAAKVIQNALDECNNNDIVIVTNGVYAMGGRASASGTLLNRAYVPYRVSMFSLNGPEHTIILGNGPVGSAAIRCAYLNNNSILSGFTLSNGHTHASGNEREGGGVYGFGVISNCVITSCASGFNGGGVNQTTVFNSKICNNRLSYSTPRHRG